MRSGSAQAGQEHVWLVTGASGQVGGALARAGVPGVRMVTPTRAELDLADPAAIASRIDGEAVTAIVNCAAYTAVDKAETEQDIAFAINGRAPGLIGAAAAQADIPVIHVSTDYVFSGDRPSGAYCEDDAPSPQSVYGHSKLAGEQALAQSGARYAIIRTSWVVSATGANFVKTMLRLGQERSDLSVVADQHGRPTAATDLAGALAVIAQTFERDRAHPSGIWHCANAGEASWHDLAVHIFARAGRRGWPVPNLRAISTADYPTPARRPANSRLDTRRIQRDFGLCLRDWRVAVDEIVDQLCSDAASGV